jgi:hypothetical protein
MVAVIRLVTLADIDEANGGVENLRGMAVKARHGAVLEDGGRVVLLDDRGWNGPWARQSKTSSALPVTSSAQTNRPRAARMPRWKRAIGKPSPGSCGIMVPRSKPLSFAVYPYDVELSSRLALARSLRSVRT